VPALLREVAQSEGEDRMTPPAEAEDFAIMMGYEAMRICTHGTTKKMDPEYVLIWMRCMLDLSKPLSKRTVSKQRVKAKA
jgi:hypothetical protein